MNSHFICKIGLKAAEQFNNGARGEYLSALRQRGRQMRQKRWKLIMVVDIHDLLAERNAFVNHEIMNCHATEEESTRVVNDNREMENFSPPSRDYFHLFLGNENVFLAQPKIAGKLWVWYMGDLSRPIHVNFNIIKLLWLPFATF